MWTYNTNYLSHHGIKGQKWGVRRYQNEDGTLTPDGKIRYSKGNNELKGKFKEASSKINSVYSKRYDEMKKNDKEQEDYINNELKKRTGLSTEEAYDKAYKQNKLMDEGKLKYNDSLWKDINEVEDDAFDIYSEKSAEISRKYSKEIQSIGEKFVDDYMKDSKADKILYKDLEKLSDVYDKEHEVYYDPVVDEIFNSVYHDFSKYTVDYDDNGFYIKKK